MMKSLEEYRPSRSILYMPASNGRVLEKAPTIGADAVILDLEDSVAPQSKADARQQLINALETLDFGSNQVIVRVNGLQTAWGQDDLSAVARCSNRISALLAPKIYQARDIIQYNTKMDQLGYAPSVRLWVMMETPLAMLKTVDIAQVSRELCGNRLSAMVMGTNDLAKDTGVSLDAGRVAMHPWLMSVIAAARAFDLLAIDGVFNNINDLGQFEVECRQGKEFGFDGKTLIHPKQIDIANRQFSPTSEEIAIAQEIVAAFALPENMGKGVISLNNRMVERLHEAMAQRLLSRVGQIEKLH